MSYQVIARKWRPQTFEDVTGQEAITRTLRNAVAGGRLHHAYLFAGPRGVGKTTSARLLAKALNCADGPTPAPCGVCPSCLEVTAGNSIDVLEIDAASHTGVDNIRDVIVNTVANRPARDRYKIFIIDEIHMLSTSAFNALLKTLEEPPPHVVFIMATTELHKLPETILSRCQQFEFRTIGVDKIAQRLALIAREEGISISPAALLQLAYAGRGSMRDAQSAFDQVIAFTGMTIEETDVRESLGLIGPQFLGRVVDALAAGDGRAMLTLTDELVRTGYDLRQFLRELMTYLRHLLVYNVAGLDAELLPVAESERAQLERQAKAFSNEDLVRFFSLLTDAEQRVRFSEEPRHQLEMALVKLTQLARLQSLETILERLERLGGASGGTSSAPLAAAPAASQPPPVRPSSAASARGTAPPSYKPPAPARAAPLPPENAARLPLGRAGVPPRAAQSKPSPPGEEPPWEDAPPPEPPADWTAHPVAPPAVESGGPPPGDALTLLNRLKSELEAGRKMVLSAQVDFVERAELTDDELTLFFPASATEAFKYVSQPRETVFIQEILRRLTGRTLRPRAKIGRDDATATHKPSEAQVARANLLKQAEADSVVQTLLQTFRGEVTDVTPPGG
jgi:DNA polymerase III subunit gamma/tau